MTMNFYPVQFAFLQLYLQVMKVNLSKIKDLCLLVINWMLTYLHVMLLNVMTEKKI